MPSNDSITFVMLTSNVLKVFVYGTLKRGEPNHNWLTNAENGNATFNGVGKTAEAYPLVIASKYNIPFLLDFPGKGHNVIGEIYQIDDKMLSNLDILEDFPKFYTRRLERILLEDQGNRSELCLVYFLSASKPHLLDLPALESYSSMGDHGLLYTERYARDPTYNLKADVQTDATTNQP